VVREPKERRSKPRGVDFQGKSVTELTKVVEKMGLVSASVDDQILERRGAFKRPGKKEGTRGSPYKEKKKERCRTLGGRKKAGKARTSRARWRV